jgi:hypothetical protein
MARKATKAKTKENVVDLAVAAAEAEAAANETPRDRFLRLAPPRTEAALKRITLLSNLARSGYEYTHTEGEQIIEALFDAVHDLKRKFEKSKSGKKEGFAFKTAKK